jgi:polyhydroxyalkanoate synthesis regulator phasin
MTMTKAKTTKAVSSVNVIGQAKEELKARIASFCSEKLRSYAEIVKHGKVTDSKTRYVLRELMHAGKIEKSGSRENTGYRSVKTVSKTAGKKKVA